MAAIPGGYVLFFTPEAGVVPHFTAQAVMARTLKERGHKILMVRCNTVLDRCPVMDMYILDHKDPVANKKQVCGQCLHVSKLFLEGYGLESVALNEVLTPDIVKEVDRVMASAPRDLRELSYDGIDFGKLCVISLVHSTKISNFDSVSDEVREAWCQFISSAMTSYLLVKRLCADLPISAIVTHEDYSPLVAARLAGGKAGIPTVTTTICQHASNDRRRYQFFQMPAWGQAFLNIQLWPQFRELAIPAPRVTAAMDDVIMRFGSTTGHVYSPQKTFAQGDFRDTMGIPKGKKLLVLFTSSLDEMIAATSQQDAIDLPRIRLPQTFPDQIEWIRQMIDFVKREPDYHLVVRIHPREGANRREAKRSQHLQMLQEAFSGEFENCQIVWPETQISSYDLSEVADLVLVSWSTMGIELSRLGVPVLASTFGNAPRPWDDFHEWASTSRQYFRKLKEMTGSAPRPEAIKHAFRWYIMHYFGFTIDFSDVIPTRDFHGVPEYTGLPACAPQLERTILEGEDVISVYRRELETAQGHSASRDEEAELKRQMRRAVHFLMTGTDPESDADLLVSGDANAAAGLDGAERDALERGSLWLLIAGPEGIEYHYEGKISRRYSPMALRMARFGCRRIVGRDPANHIPSPAATETSWSPAGPVAGLEAALAEAGRLRDAKNFRQARELAEKHARERGDAPEWGNFLGHLAYLEGNAAQAKTTLTGVTKRWPEFAKAHNNLAAILWAEGEQSPSLEHMARALELEPSQRDIVFNGTRILLAMGMKSEAKTLTDAYLQSNPDDAGTLSVILAGETA